MLYRLLGASVYVLHLGVLVETIGESRSLAICVLRNMAEGRCQQTHKRQQKRTTTFCIGLKRPPTATNLRTDIGTNLAVGGESNSFVEERLLSLAFTQQNSEASCRGKCNALLLRPLVYTEVDNNRSPMQDTQVTAIQTLLLFHVHLSRTSHRIGVHNSVILLLLLRLEASRLLLMGCSGQLPCGLCMSCQRLCQTKQNKVDMRLTFYSKMSHAHRRGDE